MVRFKSLIRTYEFLFVCILFILFTILFTLPSIVHLNTTLIGDGGDNYLNILYQDIVGKNFSHFTFPFSYDKTLRYPIGFDFSRGFDMPFFALIGGALRLFLNYVVAYNLTVYISFILNGISSYILFKHLSKSKIIGVIGAVIFGFSFYSLSRGAGHIGHATTAGFPLLIYSLIKLVETKSAKYIYYCALSGLLVCFSFLQFPLFLSILLLVNILPLLIFFMPDLRTFVSILLVHKKHFVAALLCFLFVFLLFFLPFISAMAKGTFVKGSREALGKENAIFLSELVLPNPYSRTVASTFVSSPTKPSIENVVFVGWIEIVLTILYVLFGKKTKYKMLILYNILLFLIFSLGLKNPDLNLPLPYSILFPHFPFNFVPETGRYVIFTSLFATMGIATFLKHFKHRFALLMIILCLVVVERLTLNYYQSSNLNKPYTQVVKSLSSQAVLDIPISSYTSTYNTLAILYGKSIVSGYMHWSVDTKESRSFMSQPGLNRFICDKKASVPISTNIPSFLQTQQKENIKLIRTLKENNISVLVIHKNDLEDHAKFYFPECANARIQTSLLLPQLFHPNVTDNAQVMSLFFPALPGIGDTVSFQSDGNFSVEGFHVYPGDWLPLHTFLNGIEIQLPQEWMDKGDKNMTQDVKISMTVKQGSKLTFKFDKNNNSDYSFIKMWYKFESTGTSSATLNPIQKIYEDEDAAVFKL